MARYITNSSTGKSTGKSKTDRQPWLDETVTTIEEGPHWLRKVVVAVCREENMTSSVRI